MKKETIELIDGKVQLKDVFRFLSKDCEYIAQNSWGEWCSYCLKPVRRTDCFDADEDDLPVSISFKINYTGPWQDSLHKRPKKLKPVNEECVGNKVLVRLNRCETAGVARILLSLFNGFWCVAEADEKKFKEGPDIWVKIERWMYAERCPDVIYGDEDE